MVKPTDIVNRAHHHIGEPGGENTCVSNGIRRWAKEAGYPFPDTASVSELRDLAKDGKANGWTYHSGMAGIRVGYVLDWQKIAHVSVVESMDWQGFIRSIGSGGPSGKVAYQPQGGGYNPPATFRGYFIPPTAKPAAAKPTSAPATAPRYRVKANETLDSIARDHGTSWQQLAAINRITNPDHIEPGWLLKLR